MTTGSAFPAWIRVGIAGLLATLLMSAAAAGDFGYAVRRTWGIEEGLPQNTVRALAQTPDGALWVGTFGGLARFDGRTFRCFTRGNSPELGSSYIVSLLVDRGGSLWIGTAHGRMAIYRAGRFRALGLADGVPEGELNGLAEDRDGSILVGGSNAIRRWNGERFVDVAEPSWTAPPFVKCIHVTPTGSVLIAATAGLFRLEGGRLIRVGHTGTAAGEGASFVSSSPEIGEFAKLEAGMALVEGDRARIVLESDPRSTWRIFAAARLPTGKMLVAASHGLFLLQRRGEALELEPFDLHQPDPCALLVDREGSLWVGGLATGLTQAAHSRSEHISFEELGLHRGNLQVATTARDDVWLATCQNREVLTRDASSGRWVVSEPISDGLGRIRGLLTTRSGDLWVHHEHGVRVTDGRRVTDFDCHVPAYTSAMAEDPAGNVWIGGTNALARIGANRAIRTFSAADGLPSQFEVSALASAPDGVLWLGLEDGIACFRDDGFRLWTLADGVPGGNVRALLVHGDALWLGSYGGGLARFEAGKFARVDSSKGLYSDAVSCMLDDGRGNLWLNSNRGAFRVRFEDLDEVADGRSSALACLPIHSAESGGRGGTLTRDGTVLFAGVDGLVRIEPALLPATSVAPGIEISSCVADGVMHDGQGIVAVAPGRRELLFSFNGLFLIEPAAVRYRYQLRGFDPGWRDGGGEGVARYTSVPPGEYLFEVMARSSDGTWSERPAMLELRLDPYFHERLWFRISAGLIVAGLVAGAFFLRSRAAERRNAELQREVDLRARAEDSLRKLAGELIRAQDEERRRVALELHDDFGQRLALLSVGLDLLARRHASGPTDVAHEASKMADSVRSIANDAHGMSHRLHSSKLDKLGLKVALELLCQEWSDRHEIAIVFESFGPELRVAREVELTLYRIAQEALSNVLRHSEASSARVELHATDDRLRLSVEDDGEGFDPDLDSHPNGLGLQGMRERTHLVGGTLTVTSRKGAGTRVEITVPTRLETT